MSINTFIPESKRPSEQEYVMIYTYITCSFDSIDTHTQTVVKIVNMV